MNPSAPVPYSPRRIKEIMSLLNPPDASPCQLFDMENDPFETKNVQAQHPEIISELRSTLNRARSSH